MLFLPSKKVSLDNDESQGRRYLPSMPNLVHIYLAAIKIDLETVASIMISNKTCVRNIQSVHFKVKC